MGFNLSFYLINNNYINSIDLDFRNFIYQNNFCPLLHLIAFFRKIAIS